MPADPACSCVASGGRLPAAATRPRAWLAAALAVAALAVSPGPSVAASPAQPAATAATPRTDPDAGPAAPLRVFNRTLLVLRATVYGVAPEERAARAERRIADVLALGGPAEVSVERDGDSAIVRLDRQIAFGVRPGDVDREHGETVALAADIAAAQLREAIAARREARDGKAMLVALGWVVLASAVALGLVAVALRLQRSAAKGLLGLADAQARRLGLGGRISVGREGLLRTLRWMLAAVAAAVVAVIAVEWLAFVLRSHPFTRPWGAAVGGFVAGTASRLALAAARALPDLLVAAAILGIAALLGRLVHAVIGAAARAPAHVTWLDADTVRPTQRLAVVVVWIFALAMAYPYLPGSNTDAFRGLSVLVGLMLSLGGASLIGQAVSGLVLMYTRTLRVGEFVQIDGHEGTVTAMGTFTTRVRTGMGQELTLPNSLVMGTVTRNYSRAVRGRGFVVDATVTIGYDAPWRQVHAMLIEAARRTEGVLTQPAPTVFQTALQDFYVAYRLVCQAIHEEPRPRAQVISELHANIQDVFNEHGVQIMSPHYLGDPETAKVVPPSRWHEPPAAP
jgi:small-conductance mechanosensitive channel